MTPLKLNARAALNNLCYLLTRDLTQDLRQPELRRELLFLKLLNLPEEMAAPYRAEIEYLRREGWQAFPYPLVKRLETVESGRDPSTGLPFVRHGEHRLYLPRAWSTERAERSYRSYIETECILGGGYRTRTPHAYQDEDVRVLTGDVVVDIGAAEGLFALDALIHAKRVIVVEPDPIWAEPLRATFAPFGERAQIVHRYVGVKNSQSTVRLETLLRDVNEAACFIKMDIEGAELDVLRASASFAARAARTCWACSVYHRADDAADIEAWFRAAGYRTRFADGYMLFSRDPNQQPPYFRRGVLRAWRTLPHVGS